MSTSDTALRAPDTGLRTSDAALRTARALIAFNRHPHEQAHASWLPRDWPAAHRRLCAFGVDARRVLDALLRAQLPDPDAFDSEFVTPRKRVALLDAAALRKVALYCGIAAHRPLLRERALAPALKRQLRRLGPDAAAYVAQRMPDLPALRMNPEPIARRPASAGRIVWRRGARLLLGSMAAEGPALLARVRLKLPRRLADGPITPLDPMQQQQLDELVQLSILPERLPQWDWLF